MTSLLNTKYSMAGRLDTRRHMLGQLKWMLTRCCRAASPCI